MGLARIAYFAAKPDNVTHFIIFFKKVTLSLFPATTMKRIYPAIPDLELVRMICGQESERERALEYIFARAGWRESVTAILLARKAPLSDIEDAIQEGLIVLDNHIRNFHYDPSRSMKNYFIGICIGKYRTRTRSAASTSLTDDEMFFDAPDMENPEVLMLAAEQKDLVRALLERMDERCRELLRLYKLSFSMAEIREQLGIVSDGMTRKMAFECRKKFQTLFENNPALRKLFDL